MQRFVPPTKSYVGYIFDCDGTLIESMPLHLDAWNHGLRAAKAPLQIDGKAFMSVAGMSLMQTIHHWNRTHDIQIDGDTVISAKSAYYEQHFRGITRIEEVVEFARQCHAAGAKLAVASGGTRKDVVASLDLVGILDLFPVITTADDVEFAKPAPDLFLLAAKRMGLAPEQCLVLEDSLLGIQAANIAGMESVIVAHPF